MLAQLNAAIKAGMTDFTLYRVTAGWQASSRWHSGSGWRVSIHKDLGIAIQGALSIERILPPADGSDLV